MNKYRLPSRCEDTFKKSAAKDQIKSFVFLLYYLRIVDIRLDYQCWKPVLILWNPLTYFMILVTIILYTCIFGIIAIPEIFKELFENQDIPKESSYKYARDE